MGAFLLQSPSVSIIVGCQEGIKGKLLSRPEPTTARSALSAAKRAARLPYPRTSLQLAQAQAQARTHGRPSP